MNKIKADGKKAIGRVNPNIYGHFIEHLGRCIYGGIYEEGSPLSDKRGFRKDVLKALKKIKVSILRWPGGNFASNYHWRDGIGPKGKRPIRLDTAWNAEDNNHFGSDEFVEYCREIKTEPYICLNLGTGTLDEALSWVEYCNYKGNTDYSKLREKYGHKEPYQVKYWGIGNEIYGGWQHGHCSAKEYSRKCIEYAHFIKKIDPKIKVIAVGANNPEWDREVLKTAGEEIDYISNHQYFNPRDYYGTVGAPQYAEERLRLLDETIEKVMKDLKKEKRVEIGFDEWNIWRSGTVENGLEEEYSLADGLFAAGIFHAMHRLCAAVTMANLAQLVNVIGAIYTTKEEMLLTPVYHTFDLYCNHTGEIALDTSVQSENFNTEYLNLKNVPYLDASATMSKDKFYLAVINRHQKDDLTARIELKNIFPKIGAKVFELNGPEPLAKNELGKLEKVKIKKIPFNNIGANFSYSFPAHSVSIIEIELIK